jgi:chaperonin GroES
VSAPAADRADAALRAVRLLYDRILVREDDSDGDRRSMGGILIPATAQMGKRLAWARVISAGPNVRHVAVGDKILYDPEDQHEVEISAVTYVMLRERDVHAVVSTDEDADGTGLYL